MQNKGFVRVLAIALALVCLFYLSFSFVTSHYNAKAKEYAQGDSNKQFRYLDSIAGENVWLGYSLKQCREKEINLGLDLKGGMNVTLEVSVADILKVLSGYSNNELFTKALAQTQLRQTKSGANFLAIFQEEFEKLDPNAKLSAIFSTVELKDKIQLSSTNDDVIKVLQEEIDGAISNSFNVLRSRIDRFGVVQPNIQKLDVEGRILVELPGIKEPERVRKLLQGSANLEFWETYEASELMPILRQANTILRELNEVKDGNSDVKPTTSAIAKTETSASDSLNINKDSLLANLKDNKNTEDQEKALAQFKKNNPLFAVLNVYENNKGPVLGYVLASDTANVNAIFEMKQIKEIMPKELALKWTVKPVDPDAKQLTFALIAINTTTNKEGRAPLEGDVITDANVDFDQFSARANVSMKMNSEGAKVWERLTGNNIGKSIAIVLDDYVYSYPTVNSKIAGGSSQITGNFTTEEAKDLANVLKSGKMPAPAHIVQEDVVGPSLGQVAINDGLISFIIAFVLVLLYMIMYYGLIPGLIADGALLCNIFFLFGILASFQAVLTLPGIAGIVLTMGMAVDANVLIYERTREELLAGKNLKKAIADGYSNAFSAIIDSNLTTILTGIILFFFGTGPIKGFATTLIIGIITSFFTAIFLTRLVYERMLQKDKEYNLPFTSNFTKNWFRNTHINFIKLRKIGYIISGCLLVIAILSLSFRGLKQGIDFSGGRNYVVRFEKNINTDDVRETLSHVFEGAQTSVITMGSNNQVRISTNYNINSQDENMDAQIEEMLYTGLKPYLNEDVTNEMFVERYECIDGKCSPAHEDVNQATFGIQSSQKVGPSIADDIKTSAIWAVLLSLLGIFLYILIRFRNYAFSVGAVASLIHDTLFILGVYSVFYTIMPFSLEIDQSFIAAILTVIGYSVNDTVVVFDRIRENLGLYPKRDFASQVNNSLNATLSRTFSTSLSTAIVLIAIFIFGGEVIRGFVFALLLGIIVGTYSTLFIATPVAYELEKKQSKKRDLAEEKVK
ncbi:MAG: protein translocase subunit SecDF [Paludibacteraceae bacterium]|jgi:SecD/SecF fusion protein|nr:protein translocase subunit SecDF [Paludibacteraceae bacterium]